MSKTVMSKRNRENRIATGIRSFDELLGGGLPTGSVVVVAGPPGSGKTILTQQIAFFNAAAGKKVLFFNTLSEPTAKTLGYLERFSFFDPKAIDTTVRFVDLGRIARQKGLAPTLGLLVEQLRAWKPQIAVIDSFKAFDDLSSSPEELRKFGYEVAVNLMAWEVTALLLGEYGEDDIGESPLFSIVDGLMVMSQRNLFGEHQRSLRIVKMRGSAHDTNDHPFAISLAGIEIYAPATAIRRRPYGATKPVERMRLGIPGFDALLGSGIPAGSTILVGGAAGTGKTALLMEFIYRGALAGEKGVVFSFEETDERLRAFAAAFGWDLETQIKRGMVQIVFVPQPDILFERHLLMIHDVVEAMGARRIAIDSVSVFLHKVRDPEVSREQVFQLCSIVHNARAVGLLATDIPYAVNTISRFGVEETVVDGIVLLTSVEEQLERRRYVEVYKLRNTAHLGGRHAIQIGPSGVVISPRYAKALHPNEPPPAVELTQRLASGVPGLDPLLGGGLLARSATLVSGSAGTGKTTIALQFVLAGAVKKERGLYVTLEEGPAQLIATAKALSLPLAEAIKRGTVHVVYLATEQIRSPELFALLTDKISTNKVQRIALDAVSDLPTGTGMHETARQLMTRLVQQFKHLGATTLLTVESPGGLADEARIAGLSAIADNLITLRYVECGGELTSMLTVVKTRGSNSSRRSQRLRISEGGAVVEGLAKTRRTPKPLGR